MPTPDNTDKQLVSIYYEDKTELDALEDTLKSLDAETEQNYNGVTDVWVTPDALKSVRAAGYLIKKGTVGAESDSLENMAESQERTAERATQAAQAPYEADLAASYKALAPDISLITREEATRNAMPELDKAPVFRVYNVVFNQPLTPHIRDTLAQHKCDIRTFTPPNIYQMVLTVAQVHEVEEMDFVKSLVPGEIKDKITPELERTLLLADDARESDLNSATPTLASAAGDFKEVTEDPPEPRVVFDLLLLRVRDRDDVVKIIEAMPQALVIRSEGRFIQFEAPADRALMAQLTSLPHVQHITPYVARSLFNDPTPLDAAVPGEPEYTIRELMGLPSKPNGGSWSLDQWTGKGEIIGIFDSGIDHNHPDLTDQIKSSTEVPGAIAYDSIGHGTHVAGIIAGTGAASGGEICGGAPGAKLVSIKITGPGSETGLMIQQFTDLGDLLGMAVAQGAKIINLSWGTPLGGQYDQGSLAVDRFVLRNPDVLVIVAAGNEGEAPNGYATFQNVGVPATAKNVLTVGACGRPPRPIFNRTWQQFEAARFPMPPAADQLVVGDLDTPAGISSRGPTDFKSVKPDVLAPGTYILAARAAQSPAVGFWWMDYPHFNGHYGYLGGTSMATPIVTAAAAVLRQYLVEARGQSNPSAALLKALLILSARRLEPLEHMPPHEIGYPDFDQGFGRVDLSAILSYEDTPKRKLLFVDVLNNSSEALESRAPIGGPRKAMQTYTVTVPLGATEPLSIVLTWTDWPAVYVQNNLDLNVRGPANLRVSGNSEHTWSRQLVLDDDPYDRFNNVEGVSIANPAPGTYRIQVIAENTVQSPQGYALCVCGEVTSILERL